MPDEPSTPATTDLTFDRVITDGDATSVPESTAVVCEGCRNNIDTEYYFINGHAFCEGCRHVVEAAAAVPRGVRPFLRATVFGTGAGLAGAAIYYGVIAITNFEIGLVAILIGYMVGYAVRRGARGGSRRFQILAVALTYAAVACAYAPLAFNAMMDNQTASTSVAGSVSPAAPDASAPAEPMSGSALLLALLFLLGLIAVLPIIVVTSSISGVISAFIIFIGMQQAWKMTGAPELEIQGPFRVGAAPAPAPA